MKSGKLTSALEVLWRFLLLGLTSFGGPAAHIGYFRRAFVEERQWLDDEHFGRLVALSQFLPGPGSSQLGFAIGLHRAGLPGAIMAFIGFTLPAFLIMLGVALVGYETIGPYRVDGIFHGLKLLAVVVVADACVSMYGAFCREKTTSTIAVIAAIVLLIGSGIAIQICVLVSAAIAGAFMPATAKPVMGQKPKPGSRHLSLIPLALFFVFGAMMTLPVKWSELAIARDFYLAGSLVFGGGHVVLPLLETLVADELGQDTFLAGYAMAQAVPGPMFTLAAYLGAELAGNSPVAGALIATSAIFLPGFLLLLAFHDAWHNLMAQKRIAGAAGAINAAVVGLLISALYDPVFLSAVTNGIDMALVAIGLFLIRVTRINLAALVGVFMLSGAIISL